ncbi:substrate-binding domain-containing protein [Mastigocoleus testarum]|uniref:PBP domain-containing protein n=1 Tax=Mastigocoleus testarum BC008 TaxID=371196 RepID=A0A0V7ZZR1_9CYAN|nr:substrate-binding domain-containing protein [Mastigocoleus testarum]KST70010.1 hypothetical protein BC008_06100 [Mastigocoleus testarum BC008]
MWQKEKKDSLIAGLGLFMALTATGVAVVSHDSESVLAESSSKSKKASFPLPDSIPNDTKILIDGSSSIAAINQALKQGFEKKFPGSNVEIAANGAQQAITNLLNGKIDIAAISRGLTPEEKSKGLEQLRLRREKIAVIVSKENPFEGSITNEQFAKIFRGEITDWSQIGGKKGKIRLIDHPEASETRQSFRSYPVFQKAEFVTGANAHLLDSHHAVEVVRHLGKDGIAYVIANQVSKIDGVRILKMHQTLPENPKYPYSQPIVYVYKQKPGGAVASFLGFTTANLGQKAIESARQQEAQTVAKDVLLANASNTNSNQKKSQVKAAQAGLANTETQPKVTNVSNNSSSLRANKTASDRDSLENVGTLTASNGVSDRYNRQILAQNDNNSSKLPAGIPLWVWLLLASILGAGGFLIWFFASKGEKKHKKKEELAANSGISLDAANQGGMAAAAMGTVGAAMGGAANKLGEQTVARRSNPTSTKINGSNDVYSAAVAVENTTELQSGNSYSDLPDTAIGNTALQVDESEWNLEEPAAIVNNSIPQVANIGDSGIANNPVVGTAEVNITCQETDLEKKSTDNGFAKATAVAAGVAAAVGTRKVLSELDRQDTEIQDIHSASATSRDITSEDVASESLPVVEVADKDTLDKTSSDLKEKPLPTVRITTSKQEDLTTDSLGVDSLGVDSLGVDNLEVETIAKSGLPIVEITTPLTDGDSQTNGNLPDLHTATNNLQVDGAQLDTTPEEDDEAFNLTSNLTAVGAAVAAGVGLGSLSKQASEEIESGTDTTSEIVDDVTNNTSIIAKTYPPLPDVWDEVLSEETDSSVSDNNSGIELPNVSEEMLDTVADAAEPLQKTTDIITSDEVVTDEENIDVTTDEVVADTNAEPVIDQVITDEIAQTVTDEVVTDEENVDVPTDDEIVSDPTFKPVIDEAIDDVAAESVINDEVVSDSTPEPVINEATGDITAESVTDEENVDVSTDEIVIDAISESKTDEKSTDEVSTGEMTVESEINEVIDEEITDTTANTTADEVTDAETSSTTTDMVSGEVINSDEAKTDKVDETDEQRENVASSVDPTTVGAAIAGAGATFISGIWSNDAVNNKLPDNEFETGIILAPRTPRWAYTAWKISTKDKEQLQQQSDSQLILRLYDVTDVDLSYQTPQLIQQYECELSINHRYVAIPKGDRDYMVEIGYLSNDKRWLSLGRSEITHILSSPHQDFWFEADAELIIHGATEPGATVTIGDHSIKVKPNGTFHLRIPFTEEVMEYLMTSSAVNSSKSKTIGMKFTQEKPKF